MTVEFLQKLQMVCFVAAALMFLLAVLLFFIWNIPQVYGLLSGRIRKKAIENIRKMNEESKERKEAESNTSDMVNNTAKLAQNGMIRSASGHTNGISTEKIRTEMLTADGKDSNETTLLMEDTDETTLLSAESTDETTLLSAESTDETTLLSVENTDEATLLSENYTGEIINETTVLNQQVQNKMYETTVLSQSMLNKETVAESNKMEQKYGVIHEITFMESREIIE